MASWLCCAAQTLEGRRRGPSYCTAGWNLTHHSTSKQLSFLYSCHFKQSLTKPIPPEEWPSIAPLFISLFEVPSCWDRLEPRKRGANWMLILVWVPEMSAGKSQVLLRSLLFLCSFCPESSHSPSSRCSSFQSQTDSILMIHEWWSERTRCSLLLSPLLSGAVNRLIQGGKRALSMLTLAQLKRKSGKRLCLPTDSGVHYQFNAWSRKRLIFLCSAES